jgi:hypothetical protein
MPRDGGGPSTKYPPAPWQLGGWGVATIGFVDAAAVRATVPRGVRVVTLARGKTLGGLFFLSYDRGSLAYRELNVAAALVRVGSRLAFWLPRLYVDSAASLAGGKDIWAVPKERARFDVVHDIGVTTIDVRQGKRDLCRIRCSVPARSPRVPFRLPMPAFGVREDEFLFFTGSLETNIAAIRADVTLHGEFGDLGLDKPRFALRFENLILTVPAPKHVPRHHGALVPVPAAVATQAKAKTKAPARARARRSAKSIRRPAP